MVLDPGRWPHRIDKLVNRGLRRTQATPQLKAALAERIREQAEAAHANGGVEMYLVNQVIGQVPVSAGLVVTLLLRPPGAARGDLSDTAVSLAARGADVTTIDLPAARPYATSTAAAPHPTTRTATGSRSHTLTST